MLQLINMSKIVIICYNYDVSNYIIRSENMKLKLKSKLLLAFGTVLLFFIANILFSIISIENSNKEIVQVKNFTYKQMELSQKISVSVIQVQQYLTDASATHNREGIKEAEGYRTEFKTSIKALESLNPNKKEQLNAVDSDFDNYYEIGLQMTDTFINYGYEKGNVLMDQFDPLSIKLYQEVDKFNSDSKTLMNSDLDNIYKTMNMNITVSITLGIVSFILALFIALKISDSITGDVNNMFNILRDLEVGEGDLTKRIHIKSKDEIGQMSNSFNNFMDKQSDMVKSINENSMVVSNGAKDLNENSLMSTQEIEKIMEKMKKVNNDSENIAESINVLAENIENIAQVSQENTGSLQEICDMAQKINHVSLESGELALKTKDEMKKIKSISDKNIELNEDLGNKTEEIKNIIITIKSIADQTNLLSLNASIEAARAGEQGKGFVVVAEEIRKLAENNSQSSKTIENVVTSIIDTIKDTMASTALVGESINDGSEMIEMVYSHLEKVIEDINLINKKIQVITTNTEEESASIEEFTVTMEEVNKSNLEINSSISDISKGIDNQSNITNNIDTMVHKLNDSANELLNLVSKFKIEN